MKRGWVILVVGLVLLLAYGCADKYVTSAKIAINAKNWDKAISDLTKALEANPNNDKAHLLLAKCYREKGDYNQMIVHLSAADNPINAKEIKQMREDTWFLLAAKADTMMNAIPEMEKGARAEFESAMNLIKSDQPDSASRFFNRAKAKLKIADKNSAAEPFNQTVEKAKAKEFDEANKNFDLAVTAARKDVFIDAKNQFETAIAIDPSMPQAYAKAAYAWFNIGSEDSSFHYYEAAYNLMPTNAEILKNLIQISYKVGKTDLVDSLAMVLLSKDPNNVEALLVIAEIAEGAEKYDRAVEYYNKALAIKPDNCTVWFKVGVINFQKLSKPEDAEQAFLQSVNLCPEDNNALINLTVLLITQGKYDEAVNRLSTYTDANPDDCTGWDLLSQALVRKGDKDKALEAQKKYFKCKGQKE
jgi:tetratricopeptide (TPR) repeat protein